MFDVKKLEWTREPNSYDMKDDKIEIITKPYTDLWQRTYYHFRNVVKTEFESKHRFDQCGVVLYLNSENWLKGSIECSEDEIHFSQMRVCHMWDATDEIRFGVYACSPEDSSF